jgi:predicted enzyme related to lactoylglutathione lyase
MGRPVMHFEIGCTDSPRTENFYSQLFKWTIEHMGPAAMVNTGSDMGINGHITSLGHEPRHYITFYVHVEDFTPYLEKVESLGGKVLVQPTEIPNAGHFAWLGDPDGNIVGLWKPLAR